MFEKLIRTIHKKNSIPLEKITEDFNEVADLMTQEFAKLNQDYCCHEMAYFLDKGMKAKGYDSKLVDGVTNYGPACQHSWVETNQYILNLIWNSHSIILGRPVSKKIFTKDYVKRSRPRLFQKKKIYYDLNEDFKKLTDDIFSKPKSLKTTFFSNFDEVI